MELDQQLEYCGGIWLTRNDLVFNHQVWRDVKTVLWKIWLCMVDWKPMFQEDLALGMEQWCTFLEAALETSLAVWHSPSREEAEEGGLEA